MNLLRRKPKAEAVPEVEADTLQDTANALRALAADLRRGLDLATAEIRLGEVIARLNKGP